MNRLYNNIFHGSAMGLSAILMKELKANISKIKFGLNLKLLCFFLLFLLYIKLYQLT
jgi:hypothetical protein